jgi:hypothetical protein
MNAKMIVCVGLVVLFLAGVFPMSVSAQQVGFIYNNRNGCCGGTTVGMSYGSGMRYPNYGYSQPSYGGGYPSYGYYSQPSYGGGYPPSYGYSGSNYGGRSQSRAYLDNFLTHYFRSGFPGPR